jgi:hypothetical protein
MGVSTLALTLVLSPKRGNGGRARRGSEACGASAVAVGLAIKAAERVTLSS